MVDRKTIFEISESILNGNIIGVLDVIDDVYGRGHDLKKMYSNIVEHFRNLMVSKMGKDIKKLVDLPAHELDLMRKQTENIPLEILSRIFDFLFTEGTTVKLTDNPRFALEMVLIKIIQAKPVLPVDVLIEKLEDLRLEVAATGADLFVAGKRDETQNNRTDTPEISYEINKTEDIAEPVKQISTIAYDKKADPDSIWKNIIDILSQSNPSIASNLVHSTLKKISENSLEVEIGGSSYNMNTINRKKNLIIINKVCDTFFGKKMSVLIKTEQNMQNMQRMQNDESRNKKRLTDSLKQEALNHPLVSDVLEIFDGRVIDVKIL